MTSVLVISHLEPRFTLDVPSQCETLLTNITDLMTSQADPVAMVTLMLNVLSWIQEPSTVTEYSTLQHSSDLGMRVQVSVLPSTRRSLLFTVPFKEAKHFLSES